MVAYTELDPIVVSVKKSDESGNYTLALIHSYGDDPNSESAQRSKKLSDDLRDIIGMEIGSIWSGSLLTSFHRFGDVDEDGNAYFISVETSREVLLKILGDMIEKGYSFDQNPEEIDADISEELFEERKALLPPLEVKFSRELSEAEGAAYILSIKCAVNEKNSSAVRDAFDDVRGSEAAKKAELGGFVALSPTIIDYCGAKPAIAIVSFRAKSSGGLTTLLNNLSEEIGFNYTKGVREIYEEARRCELGLNESRGRCAA